MARKKQQVMSITEAAKRLHLEPWQVRYVCQKYRLQALPPQADRDKRCKWFPSEVLLTLLERQYRLPLAS